MSEIIVIKEEEMKSFANDRFWNNGGGYLQPHITFEYGGIVGEIFDYNHGDYGKDYIVCYSGQESTYCTKDGREEDSSTFTDIEFVNAFNKRFPQYRIYVESTLW